MADAVKLFQLLSKKYPTPEKVQTFLRTFSYNDEQDGETLNSALRTLELKTAHCLEATLVAAALLEHQGHPPLTLVVDSKDNLNHALFLFKGKHGWGTIGKSRDEGLHGREPRFRSARDLAWSYYEPYIDETAELIGYATTHLDHSGSNWRYARTNLWKLDDHVATLPFKKFRVSRERFETSYEEYEKNGPAQTGRHWW